MRTGVKIAAAVVGILLVACLLSAIGFFLSGTGQRLLGLSGKVTRLVGTAKEFEALEKAHPFSPPEDGTVAEDRLLAYLEVLEAVGPQARTYADWVRSHEERRNKKEDLGVAVEAMGQVEGILRTFLEGLRAHAMGPREFRYLQRAVEEALRELSEGPATPRERDLLAALEGASRLPGLSDADRAALQKKAAEFRDRMGLGGEPLSPNAALVSRHLARVRAAELPPEVLPILSGTGADSRSRGTVIRVD